MKVTFRKVLRLIGETTTLLSESDANIKEQQQKEDGSAEAIARLEIIVANAEVLGRELDDYKTALMPVTNDEHRADVQIYLKSLNEHSLPQAEVVLRNLTSDYKDIINSL